MEETQTSTTTTQLSPPPRMSPGVLLWQLFVCPTTNRLWYHNTVTMKAHGALNPAGTATPGSRGPRQDYTGRSSTPAHRPTAFGTPTHRHKRPTGPYTSGTYTTHKKKVHRHQEPHTTKQKRPTKTLSEEDRYFPSSGERKSGALFKTVVNLYLFRFLVENQNITFTGFLSDASVTPSSFSFLNE